MTTGPKKGPWGERPSWRSKERAPGEDGARISKSISLFPFILQAPALWKNYSSRKLEFKGLLTSYILVSSGQACGPTFLNFILKLKLSFALTMI